MAKLYKITQDKYEELIKEMEFLKTVREKEVANQIKEARSFGDLSENSEYDEAKNEQGKLYTRITEIDSILSNYEIIDNKNEQDVVSTGSRVTVLDIMDNFTDNYFIVGSQEANPLDSRISDESPFGKALLGKKIGDIAVVDAPAGNISYKILDIGI